MAERAPLQSAEQARAERDSLPRPGTEAALARGCSCAVIDNHHGRGRYGDGETYGWFYSGDCALHGWQHG